MMFSIEAMLPQAEAPGFALGDFWSLTQQAGPLRWPIFVVLAIGLVQVLGKLWELARDRRVSAALNQADVASMSLSEIASLVSQQEESMLSELQSTMLNVFQTRPAEGMLHDEISNFVGFQQDQFGVFRRRMEFLSDTAGALGLMGTVWGMFTVFFQGTAEQDVILRGMGIALITTLLGLVVSIVLNLSALEVSSFFGKRLEQVSRRSDVLRFRLMELAPETVIMPAAQATAGSGVAAPAPPGAAASKAGASAPQVAPGPPADPAAAEASGPTSPPEKTAAAPPAAPPAAPAWRYVEMLNGKGAARAGEVMKDLAVVVRNADGKPAAGVPVLVAIAGDQGVLEGNSRTVRRDSDASGRVTFACKAPETVGLFGLDVSLPAQPGPPQRLEMIVQPGSPARVELEGNHQATTAGMKLPLPLGVRVFDRFENPISGVSVAFAVKQGGGKLGSGRTEIGTKTDAQGLARTPFAVSGEAGQNVVAATVEGAKAPVQFVAFGTEV